MNHDPCRWTASVDVADADFQDNPPRWPSEGCRAIISLLDPGSVNSPLPPVADFDLPIYFLNPFIFGLPRWSDPYGWRRLTSVKRLAFFYFYRTWGNGWVLGCPDRDRSFGVFKQDTSGVTVALWSPAATSDPRFADCSFDTIGRVPLWPFARPLLCALRAGPLRFAFGIPHSSRIIIRLTHGVLRLRAWVTRCLPEPKRSGLGTAHRCPSDPPGYRTKSLGTGPAD